MSKRNIAILIVFGVIALAIWQVLAPRREAEKVRRQIRVGMTLTEVLTVGKGWFVCFGNPQGGPKVESAHLFPGGAMEIWAEKSKTRYGSRDESIQALSKEMKESGVDWIFDFGFVATPRRVYFLVTFGPDARVKNVSDLKTAD